MTEQSKILAAVETGHAGVAPGLLAIAATVLPRLDRDEISHPLDHAPAQVPPEPTEKEAKPKDVETKGSR